MLLRSRALHPHGVLGIVLFVVISCLLPVHVADQTAEGILGNEDNHNHDAKHHEAHADHHETHDDHHEHHKGHQDHHEGHQDHDGHGHSEHGRSGSTGSGVDRRWQQAYASAFAMSAISFAGVALLSVLDLKSVGPVIEYFCLAFAGVVLVADALLHLLPHAFEGADHEQMKVAGLSATAGSLLILMVPEFIGESHAHGHSHGHGSKEGSVGGIQAYGIANLVVEMLHNFVDGITIGLSWSAGTAVGLSATLAVAVHELPQELGDFVVLRSAGFPVPRLLMWNFLASLTCVAGVAMVHLVGESTTAPVQRHLMAFTGGSFLTLALNMIFPQVMSSINTAHQGARRAWAKLACLAVGLVAIYILLRVGDLEEHDHGHDPGHGHGHAPGGEHGHGHNKGAGGDHALDL